MIGATIAMAAMAGLFVVFGLMRVHTCLGSPDQEPWSFGEEWEAHNRRAIELRYELLPYLYSLVHEARRTGVPPMRPMWLEYPDEYGLAEIDDQHSFLKPGQLIVDLGAAPGGWTQIAAERVEALQGHPPLGAVACSWAWHPGCWAVSTVPPL